LAGAVWRRPALVPPGVSGRQYPIAAGARASNNLPSPIVEGWQGRQGGGSSLKKRRTAPTLGAENEEKLEALGQSKAAAGLASTARGLDGKERAASGSTCLRPDAAHSSRSLRSASYRRALSLGGARAAWAFCAAPESADGGGRRSGVLVSAAGWSITTTILTLTCVSGA